MKKIVFILTLLFSLPGISSYAKVVYVDSAHVSGVHNGTSWLTAFSNFQTAIDSAKVGDSIWVAKGTYQPAPTFSFAMKDSVKVFGGFLNTTVTFNDRNWTQNATILKGNGKMVILNSLFNILTPEAWLDGFTITGGTGGGMENSFSSPTVNNCTFVRNNSTTDAAAMQNTGSTSIITNCKFTTNQGGAAVVNTGFGAFPPNNDVGPSFVKCVFSYNTGSDAGGVVNAGCIVNYTNCDFNNNYSSINAGAMSNLSAIVNVVNCKFSTNSAKGRGGSIYQQDGTSSITGCSFKNSKAQYGGGVYNQTDTSIYTMNLVNCSFTGNQATIVAATTADFLYGGGVYNAGKANIRHCIFRNNAAGLSTSSSGASGGGLYARANKASLISVIDSCRFYNNKVEISSFASWWGASASGGGSTIINGNISNCIFEGNQSTLTGGGLLITGEAGQSGQANRCQFFGNRSRRGGGIMADLGVRIYNCLVAKNTADSFGGGLYLYIHPNFNGRLINNTITRNSAPTGGSIYLGTYATITTTYHISNNIVWGNNNGIDKMASVPAPVITYSLIQGMIADATNHMLDGSSDPLFVDTAARNYQLLSTSPCINVGRNDSLPAAFNKDLANHSRIYNSTIDLGAYEYGIFPPEAWLGDDTAVCPNTALLLQLPYQSATTYLWNTGATTSFINVSTPGRYYVTVSNILGTAIDTIIVSHNAIPVVNLGNDTSFCAGGSIVLDAKNSGATYLWDNNTTSQTINVTLPGTYSVVVTDSNSCQAADTVKVMQIASPVVNLGKDIAITEGQNITLDAGNPGCTYLWNTGATNQTITVDRSGTYSVTVINTKGCSSTDQIKIVVFPTGVYEVSTGNTVISLHPNPAQDIVIIRVNDPSLLQSRAVFYNAYGRPQLTVVLKEKEQLISLQGLVPGIYFIKTESNQILRLVKQ